MIRYSRFFVGCALLVLLTAAPVAAQQRLQRLISPYPNGTCPQGYHVVIVNNPGGGQSLMCGAPP